MASDPVVPADKLADIIALVMAKRREIYCLLFAVVFTILSRYSKSLIPPVIKSQPLPRRFFNASSTVVDYPFGNLADVGSLLIEKEVLVVMYYAPWCAQSMQFREEYEEAAKYLQSEIQFVAVNCWWNQGLCHQQNHFLSFPNIFLYHTSLNGFRYNGILTAEYLVNFIERLLWPIRHIISDEDLHLFLSQHDNAVIGFFDFHSSPQPPGYIQFYYSAMRVLERDPSNVIQFGLITNAKLARRFDMKKSKTTLLARSYNDTLIYPNQRNYTTSQVVQWVFFRRQTALVTWLLPRGTKSMALSLHINAGPTLILFTPNHPLHPNFHYSMLRESILDYNNCNKSEKIFHQLDSSKFVRWLSAAQQLDLSRQCENTQPEEALLRHTPTEPLTKQCCMSAPVSWPATHHNSCEVCVNYEQIHPHSVLPCDLSMSRGALWRLLHASLDSLPYFPNSPPSSQRHHCIETRPTYNPLEFVKICCDPSHRHTHKGNHLSSPQGSPSMRTESHDPYIQEKAKVSLQERCWRRNFQLEHGWVSTFDVEKFSLVHPTHINFTGRSCESNRTLQAIIMDSRVSEMFTQHLGLYTPIGRPLQSLVFFNKQEEVHHITQENISIPSIMSFISDVQDQKRNRHLRTPRPPHYSSRLHNEQLQALDVTITEVNTLNFDEIVMDNSKDVLLLYYAPWCGFCAALSHVYMALARYFRSSKTLVFARVNADTNDLPWEFTVEKYPTITLFPAVRKADSVTFPSRLKKSLPNLIEFVLHYGSHSVKLHTGMSVCSSKCIHQNIQAAAATVQSHSSNAQTLLQHSVKLKEQLKEYKEKKEKLTIITSEDIKLSGSYDSRIHSLELYKESVHQTQLKKRLQEQSARQLYRVLLKNSKSPHIERHRLEAIMHRYHVYKRQINDLLFSRKETDVQSADTSSKDYQEL